MTVTLDIRSSKSAPCTTGREQAPSAVADAPEWLPASEFDGDSYIPAADVLPGDYLFEFFETGSYWLPVLRVAVADGKAAITYGLLGGVTVSPSADRTIRVLRQADAIALHARRRGLLAVAS